MSKFVDGIDQGLTFPPTVGGQRGVCPPTSSRGGGAVLGFCPPTSRRSGGGSFLSAPPGFGGADDFRPPQSWGGSEIWPKFAQNRLCPPTVGGHFWVSAPPQGQGLGGKFFCGGAESRFGGADQFFCPPQSCGGECQSLLKTKLEIFTRWCESVIPC